ncbi:Sec-independent protein translocase TatB [Nitrosospira multiformis ATCC 25196]|uniref:Sec-independent protein translocase protein TatB n=2 Tax=Nitrosospira multiformis (strain ATCC 25196 / NCIMB 11849 / C 71) TaxID=323848 RepID=TATB_NITMU|nr:Sec-independent protein translocase protein TatB [Nitrosospira multiformis]Q2YAV5.1 RecName: Full=Sec-independent protein translocase protein TatB [Nitrosospira multiformis ATCC 25196]ABB74116.1 Sec-independent protein translocase TatB [Nitrosospira multiformis ATCC 25196]SEG14956.1 Sec-independent protein translocase TatB [Nitrosospira multiformis ATCC 25196]
MFDISFSEILVIAAVALIVIGPERLPKVARTLGHVFGWAQRYVNDVKSDIQREIELDELKKWKASVEETGRSIENSVHTELDKFRETVEAGAEASAMPPPTTAPAGESSPPQNSSPAPAEPAPPPVQSTKNSDPAGPGVNRERETAE